MASKPGAEGKKQAFTEICGPLALYLALEAPIMTTDSCEIRNQGNREATLAEHHFYPAPAVSSVSLAQGKLMSKKSRVMAALIVLLARMAATAAARRAEAAKPA